MSDEPMSVFEFMEEMAKIADKLASGVLSTIYSDIPSAELVDEIEAAGEHVKQHMAANLPVTRAMWMRVLDLSTEVSVRVALGDDDPSLVSLAEAAGLQRGL